MDKKCKDMDKKMAEKPAKGGKPAPEPAGKMSSQDRFKAMIAAKSAKSAPAKKSGKK